MTLEVAIWILVLALATGIPAVYICRIRRKEQRAAAILQKAVACGMDEPVSLHPVIDPEVCIGSGACVKACPEVDVLGLIGGRGVLINPSHCIGHGQCAATCPVGAITLVFGTAKRGVDIPHVSGTFETNIPGVYIAGELGGMGLIRNAVTQGQQAVQNIARSLTDDTIQAVYDLVIVGAGPAGLAAALQARKEGLKFLILDQEDLGGTILTYPRRKLVMTRPVELPLYGLLKFTEVEKETLVDTFSEACDRTGIRVNAGEKVEDIEKRDGGFKISTTRAEYDTRRVLLAIGRRGTPRKLDVPGEKSSKVAYRLLEPERFQHLRILVAGGGDSAVECALALAEQPGNTVHMSYRRERFFRLKEGNQRRIEDALSCGRITALFNSEITEITPDKVHLVHHGNTISLDNDRVFVLIGGELPTEFLGKIGIQFTRKFGQA